MDIPYPVTPAVPLWTPGVPTPGHLRTPGAGDEPSPSADPREAIIQKLRQQNRLKTPTGFTAGETITAFAGAPIARPLGAAIGRAALAAGGASAAPGAAAAPSPAPMPEGAPLPLPVGVRGQKVQGGTLVE